ncbi:MAG: hypothetical protein AMS20_11945 [Gemmatimonas sp. SG8_28]|nr:MAG: hypothetical protein AMS20_11945 [Gemmatimonas sp. SG8_28]
MFVAPLSDPKASVTTVSMPAYVYTGMFSMPLPTSDARAPVRVPPTANVRFPMIGPLSAPSNRL